MRASEMHTASKLHTARCVHFSLLSYILNQPDVFVISEHTDRLKAWQKTGWTTLRRQRYFRFTTGASYHHSMNLNISKCEMAPWPT